MPVSRIKIDMSEERRILSQMVTTTKFLAEMKGVASSKLFESPFARTVASWVLDFYEHTGEAPGRAIEDLYIAKRKEIPNEEDTELVAEFLGALSKDWKRGESTNPGYNAKQATEYFKLRSLAHLRDQLEGIVNSRDPVAGESLVGEYRRIERPNGQGIQLFNNSSAILKAFNRDESTLFTLPGALGQIVGPLVRGDFVGILGPMKRGKTWWLMYFVYRASLMGFKALFISLEMMEDEVTRRAWQGFLGQPERAGVVEMPFFRDEGPNGKKEIGWRKVRKEGVSQDRETIERQQLKYRNACQGGEPRFLCYPSYGAGISDIESELANLEVYENWVPDVIVVDYADILKPDNGKMDYRHQLDGIWKRLRGMAQERNALVVTASQTGRKSLKKDVETEDVAEDIRKIAHITKLITLSASDEEKEAGIMRLKSTVKRDGAMKSDQVVVLTSFDIGRPYLDSAFRKQVDLPSFSKEEE